MKRKCEHCETTITLKRKDIKKTTETRKEKEIFMIEFDNHSGGQETGRYITKKYLCFKFKCPLCSKINAWEIEDEQ